MLTRLTQPLSKKTATTVLLALGAILLLLWGGRWTWQKLTGSPPSPAQVRKAIWNFLEEQSDRSDFKTTLPAVPTNGAAKVAEGNSRKMFRRNPDSPRRDLSRNELTRDFRNRLGEAADYKTIYGLIGEQLWIADQFLARKDTREAGVLVAIEANRAALDPAMNGWLAARICEAYLWPSLEWADAKETRLDPEALLNVADDAFRSAGETNNIIRNYELIIRKTPKSARADGARFRLARLYEEQADYESALRSLREMQNTNSPPLQRRITFLQQRLQQRKGSAAN